MNTNSEQENDIIWVSSFDIGKKNFCFYIEEFNKTELINLVPPSFENRYNLDGTPKEEMENILNSVYKNGKTILHKNLNLTTGTNTSKYLDPEIFHNLYNILDEYKSYWDKSDIFIIEQQMSFGKRINTMALKIGQHCYSYFVFNYKKTKDIIEFPSYYKTSILGSQKIINGKTKTGKIKYKNIDKPARKKWAIKKATEIIKLRNETESVLFEPKKRTKLDDYSDTLIQLQSFKILRFIDNKL